MTKTVVVVGGAIGGLQVAHRLLKYTRQQEPELKVILVSKVRKDVSMSCKFTLILQG